MEFNTDENIAKLIDMGFAADQAKEALLRTNNNVDQAIEYLFSNPVDEAASLQGAQAPSSSSAALAANNTAFEQEAENESALNASKFSSFSNNSASNNPFRDHIIKTEINATDSSISDFNSSARNHNSVGPDQPDMINVKSSSGSDRSEEEEDDDEENMARPEYFSLEKPQHLENQYMSHPPELPSRPGTVGTIGTTGSSGIVGTGSVGTSSFHSKVGQSADIGSLIDDDVKNKLATYYSEEEDLPYQAAINSNSGNINNRQKLLSTNVYDDLTKYKRPDFIPPILLPTSLRGYLENYFAPLLMILHEVPSFRNSILQHQFHDYGFNPKWFKGDFIDLKDSQPQSRFILETQRLIAFLDGNSDRCFASIKNFLSSLPTDFLSNLQGTESTDELLNLVFLTYTNELKQLEPLSDYNNIFMSQLEYNESAESNGISCFPIENDSIRDTLYKSLHHVFWGSDFENLGRFNFKNLSDIITIPIINSSEGSIRGHRPPSIEIPEIFYPQIYTKEYNGLIEKLLQKKLQIRNRRTEINSEKQHLSVYKGQPVKQALIASLEFLGKNTSFITVDDDLELNEKVAATMEDLNLLSKSLSKRQSELHEELDQLTKENKSINISENVNEIIENSETKPDPYLLIGAIIDDTDFFYLKKNVNSESGNNTSQWIEVQYYGDTCSNFHLDAVTINEVIKKVYNATGRDFENPIILMYAKSNVWNSESHSVLSDPLQKFLTADRAEVLATLNFTEGNDDEFSSNSDYPLEEEDDVDEDLSDSNRYSYHESSEVADEIKLNTEDELIDLSADEKNDEQAQQDNNSNTNASGNLMDIDS
ncbi:hypothetical protein PACTADRAFT_15292 [Pachysolen tannophilus NRRL Y-2460]|uniref:UBA domain-containing protein n=1 Tax=Pachysolen tannophilus NRRL Y-2460 TaxID=669874 RepID=A0A1E4TYF1_PACTA|nr:hypothetical protein PACTADRAFT_15292 [Pachysolen tannophilus NRRL Y-2460]